MDDMPKKSLFRILFSGPAAAIVAAVIGGVFSLTSAILPRLLPTSAESPVAASAPGPIRAVSVATIPNEKQISPKPHLTYGTWTLLESTDDVGNDWSNSVLKFTRQKETGDGLELEGFFEWRNGDTLIGKEFVIGNYVESTRSLYIEGQAVENASDYGQLAVGSFSARLAEDNRHLEDGAWGSSVGNSSGIPGTWRAGR